MGFSDGDDLYNYLNTISMANHPTATVNSSVDYTPIKNSHKEFIAATTPNPI